MKKKKILISIILILSLVFGVTPVQNVYADGPSSHSSSSHSFSFTGASSQSIMTNSGSETGGSGDTQTSGVNVSGTISEKKAENLEYAKKTLQGIAGVSQDKLMETYQDCVGQAQEEADKNALVEISTGTMASGYRIYITNSPAVSMTMDKASIRSIFETTATQAGREVGVYHTNGSKYKFASTISSSVFNKLMALADSGTYDAYKEVWIALGQSETELEAYMAPLVRGEAGPVPVIYAVPCFGQPSGTPIDLIQLGISPLRVTNDIKDVSTQLNGLLGTRMLELMTGETASIHEAGLVINKIKQDSVTGHYYLSKWAGPLEIGRIPPPESTIIAYASPKKDNTNWETNGGHVTGTYSVKVTLGDTSTYVSDGKIKIKIQSDFTAGTYPNNKLSGNVIGTPIITGKWNAPGNSAKYVKTLTGTSAEFEIPVTEAANWNSNSTITYTVDITGGTNSKTEEARPVVFSATVNGVQAKYMPTDEDTEWKKYGNGGTTYTSWIGDKIIPTEDKAYAWHSKPVPYGESLIVASEVNNEDWDAGVAIPSTENISVKTGASAGMVDIYGYLCVRDNEGASSVGDQSNMGEDQLGVTQTNQAVTREVKITAIVTNCWGGGNKPDQLSPKQEGESFDGRHSDGNEYYNHYTDCSGHWGACHASGNSGSCATRYKDTSKHKASKFVCNEHGSALGWPAYDETHNGSGANTGCSGPTSVDPDGTEHHDGCGCSCHGCSDAGGSANFHDCSWSWWVQDAVTGDHWLGQSGFPDSGSAYKEVKQGSVVASGGNTEAIGKLFDCSTGEDCGLSFRVDISWKPSIDRQFYEVKYSVKITNLNIAVSTPDGCNSYGSGSGQEHKPTECTDKIITPYDTILSQDYTHKTGSEVKRNENMVNQGTHTYTITFNETIDAYVYRTITFAQVDSLLGLNMNAIHTISRDAMKSVTGIEYEAGTFNAPLGTTANTEGVSAPSAVGYVWRCCGANNGEYTSGNGRIEFTAFVKDSFDMPNSGNVTLSIPTEYFLGDADIKITAVQDNEWGKSLSDVTSWKPTSGTNGITERGYNNTRYSPRGQSTVDYYVTSVPNGGTGLYEDIRTGDCTGVSSSSDNEQNHATVVKNELTAIMNYWNGQNNGLAEGGDPIRYSANIISDTICYGGTTLTNDILDDAYAVDGKDPDDNGVFLFNIHAEPEDAVLTPGGTDNTGEVEAYRNHKSHSDWGGISKDTLLNNLYDGKMSSASIKNKADLEMFGGVNSNGLGGTKSLDEALASKLKSGNIGALENEYGVRGSNGAGATSNVYSRKIEYNVSPLSSTSGITTIDVKLSAGGTSSNSFNGYWEDHTYESKTNSYTTVKINDTAGNGGGDFNNHGDRSINEYGTLAISNIPLVSWTPNGMWNTAKIESKYTLNTLVSSDFPADDDDWIASGREEDITLKHKNIAMGSEHAPAGVGGTDYLNEICIYDPVSSEFDSVLGAQLGKWEDGVTDETELDQRVETNGTRKSQSEVDKYVVQSQYLWSWLSPIGDFQSIGGDTNPGSNYGINTDGAVLRGSGRHGYVPKMNVDRWVETATIAYPFTAGLNSDTYTKYDGIEILIQDMVYQAHYSNVNGQNKLAGTAGSNNHLVDTGDDWIYKDYVGKPENIYFGNGFAVSNTCNLVEKKKADVTIYTYGINCFSRSSDSKDSGTAVARYNAQDLKNTDKHSNVARKVDSIDLVGSIGNLAIHDVTDFRFSNYFKDAVNPKKYLIEGVIYEVDNTKPLKIVSTVKDICFQTVNKNGYVSGASNGWGHATLVSDLYSYTSPYYGMGGKYDELPLTPRYNTVSEYKSEAMRLGYKVYASIDTIGNYQSYLYKDDKLPDETNTEDTRKYYLDIKSTYYLYDLDTGRLYDVDLWSGASGNKERLYDGTNHKTHLITKSGSIYQEVDQDSDRRNISATEFMNSSVYASDTYNSDNIMQPTYYLSDSHFIGTPGCIRLDNRDISYNGSDTNGSLDRHWGALTNYQAVATNTGQRYHFTDGLTSTTVITAPVGDDVTQLNIISATNDLQRKHPHAVLVEFQTYTAHGTVWTLKYKGSKFHTTSFNIYDTTEDKYIPEDFDIEKVKLNNTVTYIKPGSGGNVGQDVYNPNTEGLSSAVDPDAIPLVVMEAYHSAAEDRTVSGTH